MRFCYVLVSISCAHPLVYSVTSIRDPCLMVHLQLIGSILSSYYAGLSEYRLRTIDRASYGSVKCLLFRLYIFVHSLTFDASSIYGLNYFLADFFAARF